MTAELQSARAEPRVFPIPLPADAFGTSDGMRAGFLGWQDLDRIWADITAMIRCIPPITKGERRPPGFSTVTGPSEVTIFPMTLDATEDTGDGMAALAIAAETGEEAAFVRAVNKIDWLQRPAADFVRAVHLALATGAHLFARNLAAQGARLHPDYLELQKMAYILTMPRTLGSDQPSSLPQQAGAAFTEADVEREVIVHLPPKRTFEMALRVHHRGRARPNITLEWTLDQLEET
jgi:hypothetical protein